MFSNDAVKARDPNLLPTRQRADALRVIWIFEVVTIQKLGTRALKINFNQQVLPEYRDPKSILTKK